MSATDRARRFIDTLTATAGGSLVLCATCGSARVDHVSSTRIRCADCEHEAPLDGFRVVRAQWMVADLPAAVRRVA